MQKLLQIQLAGVSFQIEESAYQELEKFFAKLKQSYNNDNNQTHNTAEKQLCQMFVDNASKYAITSAIVSLPLVQLSIQNLGISLDLHTNLAAEKTPPFFEKKSNFSNKKLFRNPNNRIFGGVFAGVCAYFGLQTWVVRILFLISLYLFGFSFWGYVLFWTYILLWIALPKAKNMADFAAMQGKPATLNGTIDAATLAFENIKNGKFSEFYKPIVSFIRLVSLSFITIIRKFTGAGLFLFVFVLLFIFTIIFLGYSSNNFSFNGNVVDFQNCLKIVFSNAKDFQILTFCISIAAIIFVFYLFIFAFWLIKGKWLASKILHICVIITFLFSFIVGYYYLNTFKSEFAIQQQTTQKSNISSKFGDVLLVLPYQSDTSIGVQKLNLNWFNIGIIVADSGLYSNNITLQITKNTNNDAISLAYTAIANGKDSISALQNIKTMQYKFSKINNTLLLDDYFKLLPNTLWRNQSIILTLSIPENQLFRLDVFMKSLKLNFKDLNIPADVEQDFLYNKTLMIENNNIKVINQDDYIN